MKTSLTKRYILIIAINVIVQYTVHSKKAVYPPQRLKNWHLMPNTHNKPNETQQGVGFLSNATIYRNHLQGYPPSGWSFFFITKRQALQVLGNLVLYATGWSITTENLGQENMIISPLSQKLSRRRYQ